MKNFSKYFLMGTVALSGMTAFTACSSENEQAQRSTRHSTVVP